MRVAFVAADKDREARVAEAFIAGVNAAGDDGRVSSKEDFGFDCDVAAMVGVKSKRIWDRCRESGISCVMVDRGYFRSHKSWRFSVNAHHPTDYLLGAKHSAERWNSLGVIVRPWRRAGSSIVIAGSSEKYHDWYGLEHPTVYAKRIIDAVKWSGRPVVYRPKPSWGGKEPIDGSVMSTRRGVMGINSALYGAHVLVTHGSNACLDAVVHGIPSIVLGSGVTRWISSQDLSDLSRPKLASHAERMQFLANIAWCQFSLKEMESGLAWNALRPRIDAGQILP